METGGKHVTAEPTREQIEIMRHTYRTGRFNGDSAEMDGLVTAGLMFCMGKPEWSPASYYNLTPDGREWLRQHPPAEISLR